MSRSLLDVLKHASHSLAIFPGRARNYVSLLQMCIYVPTVQLSAIAPTCVLMRHVPHSVGPVTLTSARQTHAIGAASYSTRKSHRRKSVLVGDEPLHTGVVQWTLALWSPH